MKTWKKALISSAVLSLTAGAAVLTTPKTEAASTTTIKLWVPTNTKKAYAPTVKQFEKENKGFKVSIIESDHSKAQENVKKDPSKAADVFALPHDQVGQLVESGVLQEIPEKYSKMIMEEDTEQALLGAQYKGKTYAFPYGIESQVLFYNKSKLSEEDVTSYETITEKATFGATFKQMNAYSTGPLFMSVGDTLFGENGENPKGTNWGNEAGVSVLKWIAAQKDNKGFVNLNPDNVMSKFGDGSVAAIQSGPWDFDAAKKAIGEENIGVAIYPKVMIGDQEVQQKAFLGVRLFAVNQAPAGKDTKRISASYKLAAAISSKESQENQFKLSNTVPVNKTVQESEDVQSNALAQAVIKMGSSKDYTVLMPKLSQMATFWTESAAILSDTYNGKIKESKYLDKLKQFDKDIANTK